MTQSERRLEGVSELIMAGQSAQVLIDEIARLQALLKAHRDMLSWYQDTALALLDRIEALEAENERLRREREVLAEAFKHVYTCENCECATCPEGTGLAYRAYRALGGAMDLLDGEKGGGGE